MLALAGCAKQAPAAAANPASTPAASRARAIDTLIERGCYQCLQQAYDAAVAAADRARTCETALLLAARAKELGLPFAPWLDRARGSMPPGPDWTDYFA